VVLLLSSYYLLPLTCDKPLLKLIRKKLNLIITGTVGIGNSEFREDWLKNVLMDLPQGKKILDAGAGESQYKKFCDHLEYTSQDYAVYDGMGDSKGIHKESRDYSNLDIVSDITSIPVEKGTFDVVMCIEVFEHLPNPIEALVELDRVLKPGGKLIMTAPFASLTHYSPYHYATGFNRYFYEYHLSELDHNLIEIKANGNFFEFLAQELRRINSISIQYSNKKIGILYKIAINFLLFFIKKSSLENTGSEEILNFGYNVISIKPK
jgi:ubiquinone/menaquinone biosynthesis C-methylase UbiE